MSDEDVVSTESDNDISSSDTCDSDIDHHLDEKSLSLHEAPGRTVPVGYAFEPTLRGGGAGGAEGALAPPL